MSAQFAPAASQRCHWYVNVVGAPLQVPVLAVSVAVSCAAPVIAGSAVFLGVSWVVIRADMSRPRRRSCAACDTRSGKAERRDRAEGTLDGEHRQVYLGS